MRIFRALRVHPEDQKIDGQAVFLSPPPPFFFFFFFFRCAQLHFRDVETFAGTHRALARRQTHVIKHECTPHNLCQTRTCKIHYNVKAEQESKGKKKSFFFSSFFPCCSFYPSWIQPLLPLVFLLLSLYLPPWLSLAGPRVQRRASTRM